MGAVTPAAMVAMLKGKADGEMVYVRVKEPNGNRYEGRIMDLTACGDNPRAAFVTIEATDGEVVWGVPVLRIQWCDVRPFQRFTGYGVAQFVADFGSGV